MEAAGPGALSSVGPLQKHGSGPQDLLGILKGRKGLWGAAPGLVVGTASRSLVLGIALGGGHVGDPQC